MAALAYHDDKILARNLRLRPFFCLTPAEPFFRSLIAATKASVFFLPFLCLFLLFDRAAGFLPPRPWISDAGARRGCQGRPSLRHRGMLRRFQAAPCTASSTAADWMTWAGRTRGCRICSLWSSLVRIDVAARSTVLYAVQGRWPHHGLRVSTPLCPERAQQEIDAGRIARSSRPVPTGTAFRRENRRRDIRSASSGWRCSLSVPLERRAAGPHAMQDDGKLAGNRHRCLFRANAFAKGLAPGLQPAWPRRPTEQHFGCLEQKAAHHAISAFGDAPRAIDLAGLVAGRRHAEVGCNR